MANIELIIWDFDGVLVDSEYIAGQVRTELLCEYGVETDLDTVLRRFVGVHGDVMTKHLTKDIGPERIEAFNIELKIRNKAAFIAGLKTLPYAVETVAKLRQPICIGSNSSLASLLYKLEMTGLAQYFPENKLYVGAMFDNPKPAPDIYLHAAKIHGVLPENCLVIEDSVPGTQAAIAAGMQVIGYYGASHCYDDYEAKLTDAGAILTFNDMRQLHEIIDNL